MDSHKTSSRTRAMHHDDDITPSYDITMARSCDVASLPSIELAADSLFFGYAPNSDLAVVSNERDLEEAQARGHLWVALAEDAAVGFAYVRLLAPAVAHLEELAVHPEHGRRGLGRRLVSAVCAWAAASGCEAVTLTTYRDVPWNMPFYASMGFTWFHLNR